MTANPLQLSRREREIMDILFRLDHGSADEVLRAMAAPPSYSAVRALLRILEEKGAIKHRQIGRKYVFFPAVHPESASRSALRHLLHTFFSGSIEKAVASFLEVESGGISDEELDRMAKMIKHVKTRRQQP